MYWPVKSLGAGAPDFGLSAWSDPRPANNMNKDPARPITDILMRFLEHSMALRLAQVAYEVPDTMA